MPLLMQQSFNQSYIKQYLIDVHNYVHDEMNRSEDLCRLLELDYENNNQCVDYNDYLTQGVYLLRYAYAYIFEYKLMYRNLLDVYEKNTIHILSIGCGACIDFDALYLVLNQNMIWSYTGIDRINWSTNFKHPLFSAHSLASCIETSLEDYCDKNSCSTPIDVLVFPKSISEISAKELYNIHSLPLSDKLYILVSARNGSTDDVKLKSLIHCYFEERLGYTVLEHISKSDLEGKIRTHDNHFPHPSITIDFLTKKLQTGCKKYEYCLEDKKENCYNKIHRWPILNANEVCYDIVVLEKTNDN